MALLGALFLHFSESESGVHAVSGTVCKVLRENQSTDFLLCQSRVRVRAWRGVAQDSFDPQSVSPGDFLHAGGRLQQGGGTWKTLVADWVEITGKAGGGK